MNIISKSVQNDNSLVTLNVDNCQYMSKPTSKDVALIRNRLAIPTSYKTITIDDVANAVTNGQTITASETHGTTAKDVISQQLFIADIDNNVEDVPIMSVEDAKDVLEARGLPYAFMYYSFSHSEEKPKFRVVLQCEEKVTDFEEIDKMNKVMSELFSQGDKACKDRGRLYYGTDKGLATEITHQTFKKETLLSLYDEICEAKPIVEKKQRTGKAGSLRELANDYDYYSLIVENTGCQGIPQGNGEVLFNPCPICGHNDDFFYNVNTHSFRCFGASGNKGGSNVIEYLKQTHSWSTETAFDYFKYELLGLARETEPYTPHEVQEMQKPSYVVEYTTPNGAKKSKISCPLLADYIRENSYYMFVRNGVTNGIKRYWYDNNKGVYREISDDELKGCIKNFITSYDKKLLKMKDVNEVYNDLVTDLRYFKLEEINNNERYINFENGLLDIETMELKPHDPRLKCTIQIPCEWIEEDAETPVFDNFMNTLTNGDKEVMNFLAEYMGVCISNVDGSKFKKALFMVGEGDTGKSQLKRLTEKILGYGNYTGIELSELEERFGTSSLYGKRLAGSSDLGFMKVGELKQFKKATGGDTIRAEFKTKDAFEFTYKGLMWFCCNERPQFGGDKGVHVYNRMAIVNCNNVIPKEKQDKKLLDKMYEEREGIVRKCVIALRHVISNGYEFDIPSSCNIEEFMIENSEVLQFYKECCVPYDENEQDLSKQEIYNIFKDWCNENGIKYIPKKTNFEKELKSYLKEDIERRTRKTRGYIFTVNSTYYLDYAQRRLLCSKTTSRNQ